ncbi:MAG: c-type cytochrome domain-containing protein, partial [Planctomycetota bacterium]
MSDVLRGILLAMSIVMLSVMTPLPTRAEDQASKSVVDPASRTREDAQRHFATKVLPLLKAKCFVCHGEKADDVRGEYDMLSRGSLIRGGETGEVALIPGNPDDSVLMHSIRREYNDMPPKENDRLSEKEIGWVEQWIRDGAVWPSE